LREGNTRHRREPDMARQISLSVNGRPITVENFVLAFIDHTLAGMLESLKGTGQVRNLSLYIEGEAVAIVLNGAPLAVNDFVQKIVRSTVLGMVAPLKGVGEVKKLAINVAQ
jgi:hypothetical protein